MNLLFVIGYCFWVIFQAVWLDNVLLIDNDERKSLQSVKTVTNHFE